MMQTNNRLSVGVLVVLFLVGCAGDVADGDGAGAVASNDGPEQGLPAGHPPTTQDSSSGIVPPPPGSGSGTQGLVWTRPAEWLDETTSSRMRRAQYRVPGSAGDGECAVFYFGPGQGGDPEANVLRWADQFGQADGSSSRDVLVRQELVVEGIPVLIAEIRGIYSGGMTGTGPQTPRPGSMLLGAVAMGPDANWFFKLTGPEETIEGQRDQFMSLVQSLRVGG